jgi:hypothetical protein
MSRLSRSASESTVSSMNWRCSSEKRSHFDSRVDVNPLMPVSGERSSWATVATRSERSRSRWLRTFALRTLATTRTTAPPGRSRTRRAVTRYSLPRGEYQDCSDNRLRMLRPSYGRVESYQLLPFRSSKGIASDRCMPSISPGAARAIRSMRSLTYSTTPSAPAMTTPSGKSSRSMARNLVPKD